MSTWTASRVPEPPHAFANWIANEEWVIVSGAVGIRPDLSVPESVGEQTRQAVANIEAFLAQAGSSLREVVVFTAHITDASYATEMDTVLREVLPDPKPASPALTIVAGLAAPAFKVEFDVWAHRGATIVAATVPETPGLGV